MSKEIDAQTMGRLAGGDQGHSVLEEPMGDVLLAGQVLIRRDHADLAKAEALFAMAGRAVAALRALAPVVLLGLACLLMMADGAAAQHRPTWTPRGFDQRTWGTLSAQELQAINAAARRVASQRIEIVCSGNYCRGLAEDLDEALESAGHDVYLELPMFDLGKGAAISPDSAAARRLAAIIKDATGGRVDLRVLAPTDAAGKPVAMAESRLIIALGRKPR